MNTYRVLLPLLVDGEHGQGDVFETSLTEDEEATALQSGLLEIVPRAYRVIGSSHVHEAPPGGTFMAALTVGQESHLITAGHVERVGSVTAPPRKPRIEKG